jgi:hypothetical protein
MPVEPEPSRTNAAFFFPPSTWRDQASKLTLAVPFFFPLPKGCRQKIQRPKWKAGLLGEIGSSHLVIKGTLGFWHQVAALFFFITFYDVRFADLEPVS